MLDLFGISDLVLRISREAGPGDVAQLGERRLCKPEVVGSSPIVSIIVRCYEFVVHRKITTNNELRTMNYCVL
jgi:hypothetical protein